MRIIEVFTILGAPVLLASSIAALIQTLDGIAQSGRDRRLERFLREADPDHPLTPSLRRSLVAREAARDAVPMKAFAGPWLVMALMVVAMIMTGRAVRDVGDPIGSGLALLVYSFGLHLAWTMHQVLVHERKEVARGWREARGSLTARTGWPNPLLVFDAAPWHRHALFLSFGVVLAVGSALQSGDLADTWALVVVGSGVAFVILRLASRLWKGSRVLARDAALRASPPSWRHEVERGAGAESHDRQEPTHDSD